MARRAHSAERTLHPGKGVTKDMGINLRSTHISRPQQRGAAPRALAAAPRDDLAVDVFEAQPTGFHNTQPRTLHQQSNQFVRLRQQSNDLGCVAVRRHCRNACRAFGPDDIAQRAIQHLSIEQRAQHAVRMLRC